MHTLKPARVIDASPPVPLAGLNIAVMEADTLVRLGLEMTLGMSGANFVIGASSGAVLSQYGEDVRRPDVLVADPVLGRGVDFYKEIATLFHAFGAMPVILSTAHLEWKDEAWRNGWQFLLKPYWHATLERAIGEALNGVLDKVA